VGCVLRVRSDGSTVIATGSLAGNVAIRASSSSLSMCAARVVAAGQMGFLSMAFFLHAGAEGCWLHQLGSPETRSGIFDGQLQRLHGPRFGQVAASSTRSDGQEHVIPQCRSMQRLAQWTRALARKRSTVLPRFSIAEKARPGLQIRPMRLLTGRSTRARSSRSPVTQRPLYKRAD
jgi:hypothetical protein